LGIDTQAIQHIFDAAAFTYHDQVTIEGGRLTTSISYHIVNLDSLEENGWLEEEESFLNLHCLVW